MKHKQLDDLYCLLSYLLESCTPKEMGENRDAIQKIKTLIIKKMNLNK